MTNAVRPAAETVAVSSRSTRATMRSCVAATIDNGTSPVAASTTAVACGGQCTIRRRATTTNITSSTTASAHPAHCIRRRTAGLAVR